MFFMLDEAQWSDNSVAIVDQGYEQPANRIALERRV
jgi:hypothetical protein